MFLSAIEVFYLLLRCFLSAIEVFFYLLLRCFLSAIEVFLSAIEVFFIRY